MKRSNSLNDLLIEELADLLNAEYLLVETLPKMAQVSQSSALKIVLEDHLKVAQDQAGRLRDIFSNMGQNPSKGTCKAMKSIVTDGEVVLSEIEKSLAHDAAIISLAQRMEQYEITGYQVACEYAADLGHTRIVELLNQVIEEERVMNLHLNELAQYMINVQAIDPTGSQHQTKSGPKRESGGFYVPEEKFSRGVKNKPKTTDVSRFIDEGNPNIQEPPEKEE